MDTPDNLELCDYIFARLRVRRYSAARFRTLGLVGRGSCEVDLDDQYTHGSNDAPAPLTVQGCLDTLY